MLSATGDPSARWYKRGLFGMTPCDFQSSNRAATPPPRMIGDLSDPGAIIFVYVCSFKARRIPSAPRNRRGVAQPGRAPGSGPGGRRFKSSLPDQFRTEPLTRDSLLWGILSQGVSQHNKVLKISALL
jgi:hypothetical protein